MSDVAQERVDPLGPARTPHAHRVFWKLSGCFVFLCAWVALCFRAFAQPVPLELLHQLRKGMTGDEVRQVLGPPSEVHGQHTWIYSRLLVFGWVTVYFVADGTYSGDYNYERF